MLALNLIGAFVADGDHLSMFSVSEENLDENMEECAMYPDIESPMENFQSGENVQDNREPVCNLEWADDIDVINVLHGVSEWPVTLQVTINYGLVYNILRETNINFYLVFLKLLGSISKLQRICRLCQLHWNKFSL